MFITPEEYIALACTPDVFNVVAGDGGADFDKANSVATSLVVQTTGIADPGDNTADVASQLKVCAAWIVSYILFNPGKVPSVTPEQYAENRTRYEEALVLLKQMRVKPATDTRSGSYAFNDMVEY